MLNQVMRAAQWLVERTFLEELLIATPATSGMLQLAVKNSNTGIHQPFSLFLPTVNSRSCLIGLEWSGASLLGTGVKAVRGLAKDLLVRVELGVWISGTVLDVAGVGELVGFF